MNDAPQYVLLSPRGDGSRCLDLGHGLRSHMFAALYASGVDVFAPHDPALDGRTDPRPSLGGAPGRLQARGPLRPIPSGFVTVAVSRGPEGWRGRVTLLDGWQLEPIVEVERSGDAGEIMALFEQAVRAILAVSEHELPLTWREIFGDNDPDDAVVRLLEDGADHQQRLGMAVPAALN